MKLYRINDFIPEVTTEFYISDTFEIYKTLAYNIRKNKYNNTKKQYNTSINGSCVSLTTLVNTSREQISDSNPYVELFDGLVVVTKDEVLKRQELKLSTQGYKVRSFKLCNGSSKSYNLHDIIYEVFVGPIIEVVHHKDGNKLNNNPVNLITMTRAEHALVHNLSRWK